MCQTSQFVSKKDKRRKEFKLLHDKKPTAVTPTVGTSKLQQQQQ
jgi:hypothetical protein